MIRRISFTSLTPSVFLAFAVACSAGTASTSSSGPPALDANGDNLADDLGSWVVGANNTVTNIDINHDGTPDGPEVNLNGMMCLALDTDCDGVYDSLDCTGHGIGFVTSIKAPATNVPGCPNRDPAAAGGGGSGGASSGTGGGSNGTAGATGASMLGAAQYQGAGETTARYDQSDVYRNGVGYMFIANGWGSGWQSHDISYNGTSFIVNSLNGSQGTDYSPAGYPSVFCGYYSMKQSAGSCGLPAAISSLTAINTGWRWKANGNNGQYNAAWDIWLGTGTTLSAYLMVWLRDPPGQQPAGAAALSGATVTGLPGTWTIWKGTVNGHPIVNYVTAEGQDRPELEYNVMDVYKDAMARGYSLPGDHIMAVAIGYEVWNGPISNVSTDDFYVDVH
jgi:Glycosyl hydrolase family 12